jgi:hypothetical protein
VVYRAFQQIEITQAALGKRPTSNEGVTIHKLLIRPNQVGKPARKDAFGGRQNCRFSQEFEASWNARSA